MDWIVITKLKIRIERVKCTQTLSLSRIGYFRETLSSRETNQSKRRKKYHKKHNQDKKSIVERAQKDNNNAVIKAE